MALWISDLFMERVKENKEWSLFDSNRCPGLTDVYGDEYKKLYEKYEREGRAVKENTSKKDMGSYFKFAN